MLPFTVPIKEGQTIQWSKDTKGVIRSRKSKKDRQYNRQKGETIIYIILHRELLIEPQEPY
jgi:hypothetical protein